MFEESSYDEIICYFPTLPKKNAMLKHLQYSGIAYSYDPKTDKYHIFPRRYLTDGIVDRLDRDDIPHDDPVPLKSDEMVKGAYLALSLMEKGPYHKDPIDPADLFSDELIRGMKDAWNDVSKTKDELITFQFDFTSADGKSYGHTSFCMDRKTAGKLDIDGLIAMAADNGSKIVKNITIMMDDRKEES